MPFTLREILELHEVDEDVILLIDDDYKWYKRHLDLAMQEIDYLYGVLNSLEIALADANR